MGTQLSAIPQHPLQMPPGSCGWPSLAETVGNFFAYDVMHGFTSTQKMGPAQRTRVAEVTTAVVEPNSPVGPYCETLLPPKLVSERRTCPT